MKVSKVILIRRPAKLPSGRKVTYWTLRWSNGAGGTCSESLGRTDKVPAADAKAAQRQKMLDLGLGKVRHKRQKVTLADFLEADRESIRFDSKPSTIVAHLSVSNHLIAVFGADIRLDEINEDHVARLKVWLSKPHVINDRRLSPCSRATIRKSVVTAKAMWNRAMDRDKPLVDRNPFRGKQAKVQSKAMRIFSCAEIDVLVDVSPDLWWQCFIRLGFSSGMRLAELLNVTWADIDEDGGYITVSAKRAGTFTAGGQTYPILPFSSKSHKPRRVPLHHEAAKLLQRLKLKSAGSIYPFIDLARLRVLAATEDMSQEILGGRLVNNLLRMFKRLQGYARARLAAQRGVEIHEIEWPIGSVHDLRRSFATHMAPHVSMVELQHLMGHSSITTTAAFYVNVSDDLGEKLKVAFG